jgi:hypothetical protein
MKQHSKNHKAKVLSRLLRIINLITHTIHFILLIPTAFLNQCEVSAMEKFSSESLQIKTQCVPIPYNVWMVDILIEY